MKINTTILFYFFLVFTNVTYASDEINLDGTGQTFACATGDTTSSSAIVWFRLDDEKALTISYGTDPHLAKSNNLAPITASEKTDKTVQTTLTGLKPNTRYYFRGTVAGKKPGPVCQFKTAPVPSDKQDVVFAFSGDQRETYMPFSIMDAVRKTRPDFFLFLGDTIYADYDAGAAESVPEYWAKYRTVKKDQPSQRLYANTSLYTMWDDHEVENNYEPDSELIPKGRQAFLDYWPITRDKSDSKRLYRSFRWGKAVEIFLLDTRPYRNLDKGEIIGPEQKKWLLDGIAKSDAIFKFIATPVPISVKNHPDKWGPFVTDRDEVLTFMEDYTGIIFLTADVHFAADSTIPGYDETLREIYAGPLGTKPNSKDRSHYNRFFFYYNEGVNYCLIKVFPNAKKPYAQIEIRDPDNKVLYSTRIGPNG